VKCMLEGFGRLGGNEFEEEDRGCRWPFNRWPVVRYICSQNDIVSLVCSIQIRLMGGKFHHIALHYRGPSESTV